MLLRRVFSDCDDDKYLSANNFSALLTLQKVQVITSKYEFVDRMIITKQCLL